MPATFYKLTRATRPLHGEVPYHEGINVDPLPWNPEVCCAGGLHFTTLNGIGRWASKYTHVWDVEIPEGETRVALGRDKGKAHSLRMSRMRDLRELLWGETPEEQARLLRAHPELTGLVSTSVETRRAYNAATAVVTAGDQVEWSNGMVSSRSGDRYICRYHRDVPLYGGGTLQRGSVAVCDRVEAGLMSGRVDLTTRSGNWQYNARDSYAHGRQVHTDWDGTRLEYWRKNGKRTTEAEFQS